MSERFPIFRTTGCEFCTRNPHAGLRVAARFVVVVAVREDQVDACFHSDVIEGDFVVPETSAPNHCQVG